MLATTPQKALLRLLYLREFGKRTGEDPGNLETLMKDLIQLDAAVHEGHYGLTSLISPDYVIGEDPNLIVLRDMEMVAYETSNPHARLTEFGRALASFLSFPSDLEDKAKECFDELKPEDA
jgi:hypothetical protein